MTRLVKSAPLLNLLPDSLPQITPPSSRTRSRVSVIFLALSHGFRPVTSSKTVKTQHRMCSTKFYWNAEVAAKRYIAFIIIIRFNNATAIEAQNENIIYQKQVKKA